MAGFIQELKRRRVFRVAGLYLVVAWLLLQVASLLEDALKLPDWFDGLATALVLLGFPIALILAWAFEVTPEGVQRTRPSGESAKSSSLDIAMLVMLIALAGLIVMQRVTSEAPAGIQRPQEQGLVAIAVLPFVDLSPAGDQQYFSDGLAEELLNVLAQQSELQVAGRTSSFAFKGKDIDIRTIAQALNVTHILEGSVRKSGTQIRVTAQLIEANDGFHVFSETYDRELRDIFKVQDDIAQRIGGALRMQFDSETRDGPANIEAYDLYLVARDALYTRRLKKLNEAEKLLDRALALAPDFAPAVAKKALVTMLLSDMSGGYGKRPVAEAFPKAKNFIDRALELDPDLADAHAVLGLYHSNSMGGDPEPALRRALEINPNHGEAQLWLATSGPPSRESFELLQGLVERDPGFIPAVTNLCNVFALRGEWDRADAVIARAESIPGTSEQLTKIRVSLSLHRSDLVRAYRLAKSEHERGREATEGRLLLGFALLSLGEFQRAYDLGVDDIQVRALVELGRADEAAELVLSKPPKPSLHGGALSALGSAHKYQELADYFEAVVGRQSADDTQPALTPMDKALSGVLPVYIMALKKLSREDDARLAIQRARLLAKLDRENGYLNSAVPRLFHAELAAVTGNYEAALDHMKSASELGLANAATASPVLEEYAATSEMGQLRDQINARVDEARAELGWKPFVRQGG